ncbi:hypothetical protein CFELI_12675 [Corynebacterium felinum]|nr:hypothetical protein CFELI_12675 [Corynebacterium felinum]
MVSKVTEIVVMFTKFNLDAGGELSHLPDYKLFECRDSSCLTSSAVSTFTQTVNERVNALRRRHNTHVDQVLKFIQSQIAIDATVARALDAGEVSD